MSLGRINIVRSKTDDSRPEERGACGAEDQTRAIDPPRAVSGAALQPHSRQEKHDPDRRREQPPSHESQDGAANTSQAHGSCQRHHRHVQTGLGASDVEPTVDEENLTRHGAGFGTQQEQDGICHLGGVDVPAKGRSIPIHVKNVRKP
jgi:hypothetical protein